MMFLFGILAIYSAGYVIRRIVFRKYPSVLSPAEKIGLDIGFGSGGLALVFFYFALPGNSLSGAAMIGIASIFIVAAAVMRSR